MAQKANTEEEVKRKRDALSSNSELETSISDKNLMPDKQKKKKSKSQKGKENPIPEAQDSNNQATNDMVQQMRKINSKLENLESSMQGVNKILEKVMVKGDGSIKVMMKDLLSEMKDDLLRSVNKNIEIIEGKLFDKEQECDMIKEKVKTLESQLKDQVCKNESLQKKITKNKEEMLKYENEAEQYSRRNNIRIKGLSDTDNKESSRETASKVIQALSENNVASLSLSDIDIAHRIPNNNNKSRDIIVKFVSRYSKEEILKNKKNLKTTGIYLNEDLTRINMEVLMSIKKKMKEEVTEAWSRNGKIFYKNKMDHVHCVAFEEYNHWLELPWPGKEENQMK